MGFAIIMMLASLSGGRPLLGNVVLERRRADVDTEPPQLEATWRPAAVRDAAVGQQGRDE